MRATVPIYFFAKLKIGDTSVFSKKREVSPISKANLIDFPFWRRG